MRNLQAAMGLAQTGVEGEEERRVIKKGKCINNSPKSIKIAPASKPVQTVNPFVEVFAPPARYDSPSVEVFAPSSPSSRPSAPYVEHKKKKKAYSGCGVGLYGVGLRALSSCGSTFLSCFAGRSHLLHCPPGDRRVLMEKNLGKIVFLKNLTMWNCAYFIKKFFSPCFSLLRNQI